MIQISKPDPEVRYEPVPRPDEVERWIAVAYHRGLDDGLRAAEICREENEEERRRP